MSAAVLRNPRSLHPSLVVARFTLLSLLRRRWLAITAGIGLLLLVVDVIYTKASDRAAPGSFGALRPHRLAQLVFQSSGALTAVIIGGITLVVAMSVIRDDLGTGAAELLLTKPLPRAWYAFGKITTLASTVLGLAAVVAVLRAVALRMGLNDSAYVTDSVLDTFAIAANAFVLGVVILAVSSWGSSLAAALAAAILLLMSNATAPLMISVDRHEMAGPQASAVRLAYYASPRMLRGPVDYYLNGTTTCHFGPKGLLCRTDTTPVLQTNAGSAVVDVLAWSGYAAGMMAIMVLGIRRFSGRLTE